MAAQDRRGALLLLVLSATALLAFLSGAAFIKWCAIQSYNSYRSTGGPGPRFCLSVSRSAMDAICFAIVAHTSTVGLSCYYLFFASDDQYRDVFGYDDAKAGAGGKDY